MFRGKNSNSKTPSTRVKSGRTTNTLAKCKDYHTNSQELFDDASREVNDAKT
jgi:hypothetical protein